MTTSDEWPNQVMPPSSPTLLGHTLNEFKHTHEQDQGQKCNQSKIHFPTPLSPITSGSPNHTLNLNEQYSYHQMYTLDSTILLPLNVYTPRHPSI